MAAIASAFLDEIPGKQHSCCLYTSFPDVFFFLIWVLSGELVLLLGLGPNSSIVWAIFMIVLYVSSVEFVMRTGILSLIMVWI